MCDFNSNRCEPGSRSRTTPWSKGLYTRGPGSIRAEIYKEWVKSCPRKGGLKRSGNMGIADPGSNAAEWTSGDVLRQPVFLGLRSDKDPKDVVRK